MYPLAILTKLKALWIHVLVVCRIDGFIERSEPCQIYWHVYCKKRGGGVSKSIIKYNVLSIFEIILFMFFQSYVLNSVGFFPYKSRIKSNMWVLEAHHMPDLLWTLMCIEIKIETNKSEYFILWTKNTYRNNYTTEIRTHWS